MIASGTSVATRGVGGVGDGERSAFTIVWNGEQDSTGITQSKRTVDQRRRTLPGCSRFDRSRANRKARSECPDIQVTPVTTRDQLLPRHTTSRLVSNIHVTRVAPVACNRGRAAMLLQNRRSPNRDIPCLRHPNRKQPGPPAKAVREPFSTSNADGQAVAPNSARAPIEHAPGDVRCGNAPSGVGHDRLPRSVKRGLKQPFTLRSTEASFIVSPGHWGRLRIGERHSAKLWPQRDLVPSCLCGQKKHHDTKGRGNGGVACRPSGGPAGSAGCRRHRMPHARIAWGKSGC